MAYELSFNSLYLVGHLLNKNRKGKELKLLLGLHLIFIFLYIINFWITPTNVLYIFL